MKAPFFAGARMSVLLPSLVPVVVSPPVRVPMSSAAAFLWDSRPLGPVAAEPLTVVPLPAQCSVTLLGPAVVVLALGVRGTCTLLSLTMALVRSRLVSILALSSAGKPPLSKPGSDGNNHE